MAIMPFSFADNAAQDRDIIIFTKRLDVLLASATSDTQEAERLPAALNLLSTDAHLSPAFQVKLTKAVDLIHKSSVARLGGEIASAKEQLQQLNEQLSAPDAAGSARAQRQQIVQDRDVIRDYIGKLESARKKKDKFPTRSTLESFTSALEEAKVVPEFYLLALQNGFGTNATLRKILQSLLALWGFESNLAAAEPLRGGVKEG